MKKVKFNHKLDQSDELISIQEKVRSFIKLAQYKKAYKFLTKISKKYPKSYYIPSMLATLNAEDAWVLPDREKNKAFKIAATKLKKLLPYRFGATKKLQSRNMNEYL